MTSRLATGPGRWIYRGDRRKPMVREAIVAVAWAAWTGGLSAPEEAEPAMDMPQGLAAAALTLTPGRRPAVGPRSDRDRSNR